MPVCSHSSRSLQCQHLPLQLESLRQHSPVGSVGTGGVQAAADLLPDEVGDLEGAGPRQGRGVTVHQQELGVHGPGVLAGEDQVDERLRASSFGNLATVSL